VTGVVGVVDVVGVVTVAPGGSWNREGDGEPE
jgi:hypothetical protein